MNGEDDMSVMRMLPAALAALVLAATPCAAQQPVKVRIAWVVPIGNWASIVYEKKDLTVHYGKSYAVEPVHFQGTPPMIAALAAGELEIADLAFSSFALAVENAGMSDLRIIGDESEDGANGHLSGQFWVLKDGPVKTIDNLKGKVLATVGAGAALDIPVRAMLRRHGLEDRRDYTMVEAAFPNMLPMLLDHKIDLMPSPNPFARDPRLKANARPLFSVMEAMGGPTQTIIWAAHESFLRQHRAAMVDLLEDTVRVTRFLTDAENHAEVVEIAAKIIKRPAAAVDYVYTKEDTYRDPNMRPNLDNMQRAVDVQHETGFLKEKLDVKKYSGLDLLEEAIARIK
jgi:sulfonate transport system substrate-binding protein